MSLRVEIENWFAAFTRHVYRRKWLALFLMALFIGAFASQAPKIKFDASTEGFLREDDPTLLAYNQFRDQFGRDEMVIIALTPPQVFDLGFLEKLKALHEDLEANVPHVDEVTSLINARNTRGEGDELIVEDLIKSMPQTPEDMDRLRERVLANPIYKNLLISEDASITTVVIRSNAYSSQGAPRDELTGFDDAASAPKEKPPYLTDDENSELARAVHEVAARHRADDFPMFVAGSPVTLNEIKTSMRRDMRKFVIMAVVLIGALLFLMFRRVSGVLMPLAVVFLSLLSTVGLMAWAGVAIKTPTTILPSFLLAVCVGDAVHVLAMFYREYARSGGKEEAIVRAMGHSGLAIVMTSLTTAAGLISFATAQVAPVADLGIYASAGVMLALGYTIVLMPVMIAIFPIRPHHGESDKARQAKLDNILTAIGDYSAARPVAVTVVSLVILAVSLAVAAATAKLSHNPLLWLPKTSEARQATALVDARMKGSMSVEVILDRKRENALYDPAFLVKLETAANDLLTTHENALFVGKALSIADVTKEINKALNGNDAASYAIPADRQLVAQELLLFENSGSDDLSDFSDSQFSKARLTLKIPWLDAVKYNKFLDTLEKDFTSRFAGEATVTVTGMAPMLGRTLTAAITSSAQSYGLAALMITVMMILLIGDLRMGLLSMIPNLAPIVFVAGFMGIAGFPFDMFTMLIGSIAIGMVVDDTIHFMHNFRRYHYQYKDSRRAVHETLLSAGRAMFTTSVVLSLGFLIFIFADMGNLFNFGVLTALTILVALLADFVLAPALVILYHRKDDALEAARRAAGSPA